LDTLNIALVGNPNVGKSTLFNALTGLRQHTGNWPGKTVAAAVGTYHYHANAYRLTDLPGLYSLQARSEEERVAAAYIADQALDCAVVVCDATCLARSLVLALQVMCLAKRMLLCVNLSDEASARGIVTDIAALQRLTKLPVVAISAGRREGLEQFKQLLCDICDGFLPATPNRTMACSENDAISTAKEAQAIAKRVQHRNFEERSWRSRLDNCFLCRAFGYPLAFLLLLFVLWLTIWGANYPGVALEWLFARVELGLNRALKYVPTELYRFLMEGLYATLSRVVIVMLPPMAIFFPLFTLLEDLGALPRLAFLLDHPFERCGACGKQALTSCMSLGCNAVGVTGCRIIDSPRERLIAILTCSFLPCNGRFPTLILLVAMLFPGASALNALLIALCFLLAMAMVLMVSAFLSKTLLKGTASGFVMELPPYRRPRVMEVIVRSVFDRTVFVLGRALLVAAPAGAILWLMTNISVQGSSLLLLCANALDPIGMALGMSGAILLAFLLGFPANELVLPILVMLLTGSGCLASDAAVAQTLLESGMPTKTIVCMLLFCLFHWPCGTTLFTIRKETGSLRWTLCSIFLPTAIGILLCLAVNFIL